MGIVGEVWPGCGEFVFVSVGFGICICWGQLPFISSSTYLLSGIFLLCPACIHTSHPPFPSVPNSLSLSLYILLHFFSFLFQGLRQSVSSSATQ